MQWVVVAGREQTSDHCDQLALGIRIAVDVPLGGLDGPVPGQKLNVTQRSARMMKSRAARVMNVRVQNATSTPSTQWFETPD